MLGHQGKEIDVLKMDCEGCEYGVMHQLACNGDSHLVEQLMVEFHRQKNLGLMTNNDIGIAGDAIQCLEKERWGLVSSEESGIGHENATYVDSALKVTKGIFLALYATFRQIPPTDLLPWQVMGDAVDAAFHQTQLEVENWPKYGYNYSSWPTKEEFRYRFS
jgi:hypothetical protein